MTKSQRTGTKFSKESQLLEPVAKFAKRKGFCLQSVELPFYEYRIDFYGFSHKNNATVAIELKLNNWRRALEQHCCINSVQTLCTLRCLRVQLGEWINQSWNPMVLVSSQYEIQ